MGYVVKGQEDKVLKLKKALYGLKQVPRAWNNRIDKYLEENKTRNVPTSTLSTSRSKIKMS